MMYTISSNLETVNWMEYVWIYAQWIETLSFNSNLFFLPAAV